MAEPARVMGLQYVISADAHHDTMAVLRLALADAESPLAGREFEVEMPPPHHGQPEFIVLRSRFDAAIQRNWQGEDRCQVGHEEQPRDDTQQELDLWSIRNLKDRCHATIG